MDIKWLFILVLGQLWSAVYQYMFGFKWVPISMKNTCICHKWFYTSPRACVHSLQKKLYMSQCIMYPLSEHMSYKVNSFHNNPRNIWNKNIVVCINAIVHDMSITWTFTRVHFFSVFVVVMSCFNQIQPIWSAFH